MPKNLTFIFVVFLLSSCHKEPEHQQQEIKICEQFKLSLTPEKWNEARRILHEIAIEKRRDFQDVSYVAGKDEVGGNIRVTLSSGSGVKFYLSSTGHWLYSPEKVTLYMSEHKHPTKVICTSEKEIFEEAKNKLLTLSEKN